MAAHYEFYNYLTKFQDFLHSGKNAELGFECHEDQARVHLHHNKGHMPQRLSQQRPLPFYDEIFKPFTEWKKCPFSV